MLVIHRKTLQFSNYKVLVTHRKIRSINPDKDAKLILEAPDEKWLLTKVILVFGIFGAYQRDDLIRLTLDDVEDNDRFYFYETAKVTNRKVSQLQRKGAPLILSLIHISPGRILLYLVLPVVLERWSITSPVLVGTKNFKF